ncbi:hypothetical protein QFC22_004811 [Naganishia vaughanmartiniae]|uniref:Uncharacterized protein n=1 Tax=Naganishia vaughanmartiniae TaxID=1424756 RepID=A0ACC2WZ01_9TREE|nr:hypothetical protein QFC22_004811 [Naganishia vaughanmartiniae]
MVLPGIKISDLTDVTLNGNIPQTDPAGWRLVVGQDSHGQHKWVYLDEDDPRRSSWAQSTVDKYWLGLDIVREEKENVDHAAKSPG